MVRLKQDRQGNIWVKREPNGAETDVTPIVTEILNVAGPRRLPLMDSGAEVCADAPTAADLMIDHPFVTSTRGVFGEPRDYDTTDKHVVFLFFAFEPTCILFCFGSRYHQVFVKICSKPCFGKTLNGLITLRIPWAL